MEADFEARLSNLESALALPHTGGVSSAEVEQLRARVAALEKQLSRANYRIVHLVRGLSEREKEAEEAKRKLAGQ
jgi:uncharacterized coiled-coil protein SlyX